MIEITWLGHAVIQFRLPSGEVILIDPWVEENPQFPKDHKFDRIDTILVTHGHFDHIQGMLPLAKKFSPNVIAIIETCHWFKSKGVEKCSGMNKGGTQAVGPIKVTMTHAVHSAGIPDGDQMVYGGEACSFVVHLPDGHAIYLAGDTAVFSDMQLIAELYKPDLAFLPIGDFFTMGPKEAAMACRLLKVPKVVPMHYGTFPQLTGSPEEFHDLLKDVPGTEMWQLEIGKPVQF